MKAHIVLAHPEPKSFNGHLAETARAALEGRGWQVTLSDLYGKGFDPCERAGHYTKLQDPERFNVHAEQRHASEEKALPLEVADEIARLDAADLLILQYPMWWHLPPAMLKGWFDRVFAYGEVYRSSYRFEQGRYVGRRALLSVTVGTSAETYAFDGRSGDIDLLLWPVNFSLAYVGYDVLAPFVAYGVEAGVRYSDPGEVEARLAQIPKDLASRLEGVGTEVPIPFNRMDEWGSDGRIKPDAPAYSPFMRHRERLEID